MAYAHIQSIGSAASGAGTTCVTTFAAGATAGRLLTAACEWNSTTATCTLADNINSGWAAIPASLATTATGGFSCQWFWKIAAGGETAVTMTTSASTTSRLLDILEYSGGPASSPVDVSNAANGASSVSSASVTTVNDNDLVLMHTVVSGAAGGNGSGWTDRLQTNDNLTAELLAKTPAGVATGVSIASNTWWAESIVAFSLTPVGGGAPIVSPLAVTGPSYAAHRAASY